MKKEEGQVLSPLCTVQHSLSGMAIGFRYLKQNPLSAIVLSIPPDLRKPATCQTAKVFWHLSLLHHTHVLAVKLRGKSRLALKDINKWTNWESGP